MDQIEKYCLNSVSCMLMFNRLVSLIKDFIQVVNNSTFQVDAVNINTENILDNKSDVLELKINKK
uniref:Uncharacterized protein n=1 Tax=Strongyloides papillosus TaxID=174720 RepID=A0A0N5BJA7_STREA